MYLDKKRVKWVSAALIVLIGVIIVGIGYRRINRQFPASKLIEVDKGEQGEFEEGVLISVEEVQMLPKEESMSVYEALKMPPIAEPRIVNVDLVLENTTEETKTVDMTVLNLETIGSACVISPLITEMMERTGVIQELVPGERREIRYWFEMLSIWFSKKDWEKIEDREFWLTYSAYPEKRVLRLE